MANDKNFKVKNGLLAGRYYGSAGTETAGANGPYGTFSTTLYSGTATSEAHTVTNNIDLSTDGGLLWVKKRDSNISDTSHQLYDTERGASAGFLSSDSTNAQSTGDLSSFNTDGFTWNASTGLGSDYLGSDYVAWTFKKASNFFDVVTYTGNGSSGRTVSHSLGSVPACIIIKRTSSTEDWVVYHVGADTTSPEDYYFKLNNTGERIDSTAAFNDTAPTSTNFTVGNNGDVNANGETYVAYLFAHDTSDDGYIQCDSYIGNGSTDGPEIDLGWQPSWVMIKNATEVTSSANWIIHDTVRGINDSGGYDPFLRANLSSAENTSIDALELTDTGFKIKATSGGWNTSGETFIYVAIRAVVQTQTIDLSTGHTFNITPTDATDVLFINPPASGTATGFTVEVDNSAGGYALTWPSSVKWDLGTAPTATASKELYTFITTDGGTTYYGKKAAGDIA